jgi:hypothetical protein
MPRTRVHNHISPHATSMITRLCDPCPAHPAHPFFSVHHNVMFKNRSGWKAGVIEIRGTREESTCGVISCGTGQRGAPRERLSFICCSDAMNSRERRRRTSWVLHFRCPLVLAFIHFFTFIHPRGCDAIIFACRRRTASGF